MGELPSLAAMDAAFPAWVGLAFALLVLEAGVAAHALYRPASWTAGRWPVVIAPTIWTFALFLASYRAHGRVPASVAAHGPTAVWPVLVGQATRGMAMAALAILFAFAWYLYFVRADLVAAYHLLRDFYLYLIAAVVLGHGLPLYVRYTRYLYTVAQESTAKIFVISGGLLALILIVGMYLFALDTSQVGAASAAVQGALGVHVTVRDLWLLTLAVALYAWHIKWMAHH